MVKTTNQERNFVSSQALDYSFGTEGNCILSTNPDTLTPELSAFNPEAVEEGAWNHNLHLVDLCHADRDFNTKSRTPSITSNSFQISNSNKTSASTNAPSAAAAGSQHLTAKRNRRASQGSISSVQLENWGESTMADTSPRTDTSTDLDPDEKNQLVTFDAGQLGALGPSDSSDRSKGKNPDQKTLRRLAQNREAARKSRLRKKAYVQQLESSRLKLTQLEQELQKARQQGVFISSSGDQSHSMGGNGALAFDLEYARWLEEHNRQINDLRGAVNSHASDSELRVIVDGVMAHYDEIFRLKGNAAKADVFHVLSGMWKTPAERCFLWIGGFRSSELLKVLN